MALINHGIVTYSIEVPEADVRHALVAEALERHALMDNGKPIPGVTTAVTYDGRRRGEGAYTIHIRRDIAKSGQAALPNPDRKEGQP